MSSEEDTELRDLVAQTLEVNGCLPKLRAELRASIFLALHENIELQHAEPLLNNRVKIHLETQEGQNMFCLVREFLEYFGLDFTISVYEPESYLGRGYQYTGREKIVQDLNIPGLKDDSVPLLLQLIRIAQLKTKSIDINLSNIQNVDNENETYSESKCDQNSKSDYSLSEEIEQEAHQRSGFVNGDIDYFEEPPISKSNNLNTTFNVTSSINIDKIKSTAEEISQCSDDVLDSSKDKSQSISGTEFSPPLLKDKTYTKLDVTYEKLKLSPQKNDKLKTKSSLSSLSDLPPLQLSKSRTDTVLLPSLYNKDFKEKTHSSLKDSDKPLEIDDYEEDFLSDSENNSKNSNSRKNCKESEKSSISNSNKSSNCKVAKLNDFNQNPSLVTDKTDTNLSYKSTFEDDITNSSQSSSVTSDDLNRNDDILNSITN